LTLSTNSLFLSLCSRSCSPSHSLMALRSVLSHLPLKSIDPFTRVLFCPSSPSISPGSVSFQCLKHRTTIVHLLFFIRYSRNVQMVILGVAVLMEALQMLLIFHYAVRLCPMLPDLMVLFRMFYGLCLSFKHLA
jgi:hypothetical protein